MQHLYPQGTCSAVTQPDPHPSRVRLSLGPLIDAHLLALSHRPGRLAAAALGGGRNDGSRVLQVDVLVLAPRGLDKALIRQLSACRWITEGLNLIINGPTGVGKTWIACALAQKACRAGHTALYLRLPRLFEELSLAHGDGRFPKLMAAFAKTDLIILDDWGLAKFTAEQRRDLLELLDDRHGQRSTIVTSQLPLEHWHEIIGDPTLADAILDRLIHNAYRINLKGESLRKRHTKLTPTTPSE